MKRFIFFYLLTMMCAGSGCYYSPLHKSQANYNNALARALDNITDGTQPVSDELVSLLDGQSPITERGVQANKKVYVSKHHSTYSRKNRDGVEEKKSPTPAPPRSSAQRIAERRYRQIMAGKK